MYEKLNLGCGQVIKEGYVNADVIPRPGVDTIIDLRKFPYNFEDNTFSEVIINHVLEHLDNTIKVMEEVWRICKPGAIVKIGVPFYNSSAAFGDITHIRAFNFESFTHLTKEKNVASVGNSNGGSGYTTCYFKILKNEGTPTPLGRFVPNIKIKRKGRTGLRDCLAHIFGELIFEIRIDLQVIKDG